ncbi:MAG: NAD(P)/FAD-dependent oxidoreductase, partial [Gammaproteobacteria bacterium]|nr:NAD(P)/FAD-dependent oxidoreductase [Gammaproteobacteria bacterium]
SSHRTAIAIYRGRVTTYIREQPESSDVQDADAIVVGGGPAGSTCAWKLREAGLSVMVLDRAAFPRHKLCAGWVTPEAMADLALDPGDYPFSFMTFDELHLSWKALTARVKSRQHSIRRFEFDNFLLQRAGARILQHKVRDIRRETTDYVIDGEFRCKYLVGAGGTACPVYRTFFQGQHPRCSVLQVAAYEQEFAYHWSNAECHLWFFDDGLPGYAWYVPKANGYINVGLGGVADKLKQQNGHVRDYWHKFVAKLRRKGLVKYDNYQPTGYSYYLQGKVDAVSDNNAYIVGDAVGLATRDMCEGIGPAIKSGLLAANAIATGADYSLRDIDKLSGQGFASKILERRFVGEYLNSRRH